jgi:hypothetical protein
MAVKKSVAAPVPEATIPETASTAGELETAEEVTAQSGGLEDTASEAAAVAKSKLVALAKARAAKAAKAKALSAARELARQEAASSIDDIQSVLAAEKANDRMSFGEIREVARTIPTREEFVRVEMPLTDLFDHSHPGVQLNRHKFEPGKTYLLRGDVALEVKKRLAMFHDEQIRLLRPNADRKALNDVNRGSQWTSRGGNSVVPLGRLEDVATAADERIFTVDF